MLTASVVAILSLNFINTNTEYFEESQSIAMPEEQDHTQNKFLMPEIQWQDDSVSTQMPNQEIQVEKHGGRTPASQGIRAAEEPMTSTEPNVPVYIMMPEEPTKGWDWKGMASWLIAAVNGIVLFIINIKKLKKK